jgi:hypothetical protein
MKEAEQIEIFGEVDSGSVVAITIVADSAGNRAPGYGKWPRVNKWGKPNEPQGTEKGNSMLNMAMIRSERNALKRLRPAEMPDVEVIDADYAVLPRFDGDLNDQLPEPEGVIDVDEETGEVLPDRAEAERALEDDAQAKLEVEKDAIAEEGPPLAPPNADGEAVPIFANVGEFYTYCRLRTVKKLVASQVRDIPGVTDDIKRGDLQAAWTKVVANQEG